MINMDDYAIDCQGLVKVYRSRKWQRFIPPKYKFKEVIALDNLSFNIKRGEVFGLLGPNGAGKTTTIQSIAGLLIPDKGSISVMGVDPITDPERVKQIVGVVAGGNPRQLYNKLTARENLRYWGNLYGLSGPELESRIGHLLDLMDIADRADDLIENFSSGMIQRVIIARGLVHDPEVLLLDEPTVGLDPKASREMRSLIKNQLVAESEKTILLTTHEMHVAEELSDRIAIINRGKVIATGRPDELRRRANGGVMLEVAISNLDSELMARLAHNGIRVVNTRVDSENPSISYLKLQAKDEDDAIQKLIQAIISQSSARLLSMRVREPSLEDAFVFLTDQDDREVAVNA